MLRPVRLSFSILAVSCGGSTTASSTAPPHIFVDDASPLPVVPTTLIVDPSVARDASNEASSTSPEMNDAALVDGAAESSVPDDLDAGEGGTCVGSLAPGDLLIDELMIASVAGSGDDGEWIEVTSTLDCSVDLAGLHGESPRGATVAAFDVVDHLWLPPRGTFVIADSTDPAINHYLPGLLIPWFGHLGDVLRNKGTSVTLTRGGTLIDSITYPALSITAGTSIAFPADCDASARSDWTQWQRSTSSWFPAFMGTPNASNDDVHCLR
jgi:hypothetical protein